MISSYSSFLKTLSQARVHVVSSSNDNLLIKNQFYKEPHYLLSSSGSENKKHFVHSLQSIQKACDSFFKEFDLGLDDRWWSSLPLDHVGGFSILARSYFGGLKEPFIKKINYKTLSEDLIKEEITLMSLVPTQVFDLVRGKIKAPKSIKYVFVGGASISLKLVKEAKDLDWPLVMCYGSSETFAQMAHSEDGVCFKVYEGWSVKINAEDQLELKGPGLYVKTFKDGALVERSGEWFNTRDQVENLKNGTFKILGKSSGLYKIKGSYFNFNSFKKDVSDKILDLKLNPGSLMPVLVEEERNGAGVYLISSDMRESEKLMNSFSEIRGVYYISDLTNLKSDLGKPMKKLCQDALKVPVLSV